MFNSYFPESQRFYLTSAYAHISWRLFFKQVNTANQYFSSCLLGVISYRHRSYKVICDSLEQLDWTVYVVYVSNVICMLVTAASLLAIIITFSFGPLQLCLMCELSPSVSTLKVHYVLLTLFTSESLNWTLQKNIPHKWFLQRSKSASAWFCCCLASSYWAGWCFLSTQWQADSTCTVQLVPKASSLHSSTFRGKGLHLTLSTKQRTRARVSLLVSDWHFHPPAILRQRKATEPQTNKKPV